LALIYYPNHIDPPLVIFSLLPLVLFTFKIAKVLYLYHGVQIVGSLKETIAAAFAGLALSHTISKAMWAGIFTKGRPFVRTPKREQSAALIKAVGAASEETLIMLALWLSAITLYYQSTIDNWDMLLWIIVLLVQSLPYLSALLLSVISAYPSLKASLITSSNLYEQRQDEAN
jgi:sensor histidine kinase YesM